MKISNQEEEILVYDEIEAKIKSKRLIVTIINIFIFLYLFLLYWYLVLIHNATFHLNSLFPVALCLFVVYDLKNKIRKLKADLEYVVNFNKNNKVDS